MARAVLLFQIFLEFCSLFEISVHLLFCAHAAPGVHLDAEINTSVHLGVTAGINHALFVGTLVVRFADLRKEQRKRANPEAKQTRMLRVLFDRVSCQRSPLRFSILRKCEVSGARSTPPGLCWCVGLHVACNEKWVLFSFLRYSLLYVLSCCVVNGWHGTPCETHFSSVILVTHQALDFKFAAESSRHLLMMDKPPSCPDVSCYMRFPGALAACACMLKAPSARSRCHRLPQVFPTRHFVSKMRRLGKSSITFTHDRTWYCKSNSGVDQAMVVSTVAEQTPDVPGQGRRSPADAKCQCRRGAVQLSRPSDPTCEQTIPTQSAGRLDAGCMSLVRKQRTRRRNGQSIDWWSVGCRRNFATAGKKRSRKSISS